MEQRDNPAGWPSIAPLEAAGSPGDCDWMGMEWSEWVPLEPQNVRKVSTGAGLYLLADTASHEIVYIGQSANVGKRLLDHSRKKWNDKSLQFSYQIIAPSVFPYHLKELENDLIGNYFEQNRKAPAFQFSNSR